MLWFALFSGEMEINAKSSCTNSDIKPSRKTQTMAIFSVGSCGNKFDLEPLTPKCIVTL